MKHAVFPVPTVIQLKHVFAMKYIMKWVCVDNCGVRKASNNISRPVDRDIGVLSILRAALTLVSIEISEIDIRLFSALPPRRRCVNA